MSDQDRLFLTAWRIYVKNGCEKNVVDGHRSLVQKFEDMNAQFPEVKTALYNNLDNGRYEMSIYVESPFSKLDDLQRAVKISVAHYGFAMITLIRNAPVTFQTRLPQRWTIKYVDEEMFQELIENAQKEWICEACVSMQNFCADCSRRFCCWWFWL